MRVKKYSEAEFQKDVIEAAHLLGWRVAHFRKVRVQRKNGSTYYETPVAADGAGFPDLLFSRGSVIFVAELKVKPNKCSEEQIRWLSDFDNARIRSFVWYPEDWPEIERVLKLQDLDDECCRCVKCVPAGEQHHNGPCRAFRPQPPTERSSP